MNTILKKLAKADHMDNILSNLHPSPCPGEGLTGHVTYKRFQTYLCEIFSQSKSGDLLDRKFPTTLEFNTLLKYHHKKRHEEDRGGSAGDEWRKYHANKINDYCKLIIRFKLNHILDTDSFAIAIDAAKNAPQARSRFKAMLRLNIKPNTFAVNGVLEAHRRDEDSAGALEWLEMIESGEFKEFKKLLDRVSYNTVWYSMAETDAAQECQVC